MDSFGVPKKVNRHVLKALYYMHDSGFDNPELSEICELVEITMRNNVPVKDLQGVVSQSLHNMAQFGIIEKNGSNFFIWNVSQPETKKPEDAGVFKNNERQHDNSKLDPNLKKRSESDESCSIRHMRKRYRVQKPLIRKGLNAPLPKARKYRKFNLNLDLDYGNFPFGDTCSGDEDEGGSQCSLNSPRRKLYSFEDSDLEKHESPLRIDHSNESQTNKEDLPVMSQTESDSWEVVTAEQIVDSNPNALADPCPTDIKSEENL